MVAAVPSFRLAMWNGEHTAGGCIIFYLEIPFLKRRTFCLAEISVRSDNWSINAFSKLDPNPKFERHFLPSVC